jgi:hypothetical protein
MPFALSLAISVAPMPDEIRIKRNRVFGNCTVVLNVININDATLSTINSMATGYLLVTYDVIIIAVN